METWYRSRNADVGSIQTKDEMDDLGSLAPGAGGIRAPVKAKYIRRVIVAAGCDGAASGNLVLLVRLEGDGLVNDEVLMVEGWNIPVATGTGNARGAWISPILNFPVNGGSDVQIFADTEGDAESDFEVGVTLELVDEKRAPNINEDAELRTRTFAADMDTVDAIVDLTGSQGSNSSPTKIVPDGVEHLVAIGVAHAVDEAADGSWVMFVRLRGDWMKENQPHEIMCIGGGNIAGQSGSDEGVRRQRFTLDDMMLEVEPGATIDVDGENAGDDPGNGTGGITLYFA